MDRAPFGRRKLKCHGAVAAGVASEDFRSDSPFVGLVREVVLEGRMVGGWNEWMDGMDGGREGGRIDQMGWKREVGLIETLCLGARANAS